MRTTLRIDDDLMRELKARSRREQVALSRLVNRLLRQGMDANRINSRPTRYREKVFSMGQPVNLDKALALAASLEDDEIVEKLARRK